MKRAQSVWTLSMLAFALTGAWAQDNSTPPPSSDEPPASTAQQPVPAYGQEQLVLRRRDAGLFGLLLAPAEEAPEAAPQRQQVLVVAIR